MRYSTDGALAYDMLTWRTLVQPIRKSGLQYSGIHTAHPVSVNASKHSVLTDTKIFDWYQILIVSQGLYQLALTEAVLTLGVP
jgi:hypothetical protein